MPTQPKQYVEDENFLPEPTAQFGTLDTSGTAGAAHSKVEEVTPVFAVADQQNALVAAKAVDPKDDSVHSSLVVLPDASISNEEAVKNVKEKAKAAEKEDIALVSSRQTPAQKEAAESGDGAAAKAASQQAGQGAGGGTDGSGTGTTK